MRLSITSPLLAALALAPPAAPSDSCDCTGCPDSDTVYLGKHVVLVSPACPEGSVATVTRLRTIADSGEYELLTWNTGGSTWTDEISSPYKYLQATAGEDEEVTCFGLDEEDLPVIGDQSQIEVRLNCESVECDFRWDVEFGCAETGTLVDSKNDGGGVQVLSDVDDTIVCPFPQCDERSECSPSELKHFFAGADKRLEDGEFYPGVAELILGLALGPGADDGGGKYVPAKPMLLSARPREFEFVLGISQDDELNLYMERVGARSGMPSWGTNIDLSKYGTVTDLTDHTEFGQTKARSYIVVSDALPATRFLFMGDNGQGDVCAAQSMLESGNGDRMAAVLVHVTEDFDEALTECQHPNGTEFTLNLPEGAADGRVHYHRTHSDAAAWALDRGLLSCCSAAAVHNAVEEWRACRCGNEDGGVGCIYNDTVPIPTGFNAPTERQETLEYCQDLAIDQAELMTKINACDADGGCPVPADPLGSTFKQSGTSAASTMTGIICTIGAVVVGAALHGLLPGF